MYQDPTRHHSVYVVLLGDAVGPRNNANLPSVYVGLTGNSPEERFADHKANYKAGKGYVRDYGIRLLPELYAHLNPMSYPLAQSWEQLLAMDLRNKGYTVYGGH